MSSITQYAAVGRRKTAVARVYLRNGNGKIVVNKRSLESYFPLEERRNLILQPLAVTNNQANFDIVINARGGGSTGQAEAIKLGIARALVKFDEELKQPLREAKLLTRDPRMVERKKYGQPKARKRFQFSKR